MALIKPSTPFDRVQRKFAKSDEIHFRNRKADNATISVRMKHPYDGGSSAAQLAHRAKFAQAIAAANTAMEDSTQRAAYETAFRNQSKYTTFNGFLFATVWATIDD